MCSREKKATAWIRRPPGHDVFPSIHKAARSRPEAGTEQQPNIAAKRQSVRRHAAPRQRKGTLMKFQSLIISRGSGSLGGVTFSHNKGGQYMRARTTPTDPGTSFQTFVRTSMAQLVNLWVNVLTQLQRDQWDVYASQVPLLDQFGDARTVTGMNMYVRGNLPRLQAGLPRADDGPTTFSTGEFTQAIVTYSLATGITVNFSNADVWANEDDSAMLIYVSHPHNPSVNFHKSGYRFAGKIDGNATTAPTTPELFDPPPFPFIEGHKLFAQVRVTRADGRLSVIQRTAALATA